MTVARPLFLVRRHGVSIRRRWLCLALLAPLHGMALPALDADAVHVERRGEVFDIDLVMHTPVAPALAWDVLTDFDHLVGIVPNLSRSQIVQRNGAVWTVSQAGVAHWGPFSLSFESVRELRLTPQREIRAHALSGTARRMDSLMQLEPEPEGTRLHYHAEVEPGGLLLPGLLPSALRHETAEQFQALLDEMARRARAGTPPRAGM